MEKSSGVKIPNLKLRSKSFKKHKASLEGSPISLLLSSRNLQFDRVILLHNYKTKQERLQNESVLEAYSLWLSNNYFSGTIEKELVELENPMNMQKILEITETILTQTVDNKDTLYFGMSSGTWAMIWIWFYLSETRFDAKLIHTSPEAGVEELKVPYQISDKMFKIAKRKSVDRDSSDKLFNSAMMQAYSEPRTVRLIEKIRAIAKRDTIEIPAIFIFGKEGCPIEQIANGIHSLSEAKNWVSEDCFFFDEGSQNNKISALLTELKNGTLLLKNFENLNLESQRSILSYLKHNNWSNNKLASQDRNLRLIFSTSKELLTLKRDQKISADFLDIISRVYLKIPSLTERGDDLIHLIKGQFNLFCEQHHREAELSPSALNILLKHKWPGNDNELDKILRQVVLFSKEDVIKDRDILEGFFDLPENKLDEVMTRPIEEKFNLKYLLNEVADNYIVRALNQTGNNVSESARILGLNSHQSLKSWIDSLEKWKTDIRSKK